MGDEVRGRLGCRPTDAAEVRELLRLAIPPGHCSAIAEFQRICPQASPAVSSMLAPLAASAVTAASAATAATLFRSDVAENLCICFGFSSLSLRDDWPIACNVYGHVANHDASSER